MSGGRTRFFEAAKRCLASAEPAEKVALTRQAFEALREGRLSPGDDDVAPSPIGAPGRPDRPRLVLPREVPRRGLGSDDGRAALVHAVAHIEFNAMNLAWDTVYRFRGMPDTYYHDWAGVANDEARHFTMLSVRLAEFGLAYGDFDAHNGLWEMAVKTAGSCLARMALVPRVLEARGLDVTPGMIARLRGVGDDTTADILEVILREEIVHVAAGTRWFRFCCECEGRDPDATFAALLREYVPGGLKGPFNLDARRAAGFGEAELAELAAD
ncbi:MAG TPA: ferritin-like domain-containing protein [Rhodanobacteraceae bacterium]|nr:ferritin-like domain-containing protein [Rhodanobacteraceae bacterium]